MSCVVPPACLAKELSPFLSLTSQSCWLYNSVDWSSVWASFRLCGACRPDCSVCVWVCVTYTAGYRGGISLSKAFLFTPTNLQGAFSICSVCSLWKTSDSFFNQSQMRQLESVCAWARQCMRIWWEYLLSIEGEGVRNRVDFFFKYNFRYERGYVRLILRYDIDGFIL